MQIRYFKMFENSWHILVSINDKWFENWETDGWSFEAACGGFVTPEQGGHIIEITKNEAEGIIFLRNL